MSKPLCLYQFNQKNNVIYNPRGNWYSLIQADRAKPLLKSTFFPGYVEDKILSIERMIRLRIHLSRLLEVNFSDCVLFISLLQNTLSRVFEG